MLTVPSPLSSMSMSTTSLKSRTETIIHILKYTIHSRNFRANFRDVALQFHSTINHANILIISYGFILLVIFELFSILNNKLFLAMWNIRINKLKFLYILEEDKMHIVITKLKYFKVIFYLKSILSFICSNLNDKYFSLCKKL